MNSTLLSVWLLLNSPIPISGWSGIWITINHQYVLYDGMLTRMRYIDGSECFSKDENYSVGSTKEGANNSSMKYSQSGVNIKIECKNNKVPPQTRSPSKRQRTPKNKFSPSELRRAVALPHCRHRLAAAKLPPTSRCRAVISFVPRMHYHQMSYSNSLMSLELQMKS